MNIASISTAPKQKIPDKKKTEKWGIDCIKYFNNIIYSNTSGVRKRRQSVNENYNLVVGRLDNERINNAMNPMRFEGENAPYPTLQDNIISIVNPAINTLIGEEFRRNLEYRVFVMNPEAISEKEQEIKAEIMRKLTELLDIENTPENEIEPKLRELEKWQRYDAQDIRERTATHLLDYYWEHLKLRHTFNDGFKDVLCAAEEIYRIDIIGTEPNIVRVNPLNLYSLRSSETTFIEESDVIVEQSYMTRSAIIDEFGDKMTSNQIGRIVDKNSGKENEPSGIFKSPHVAFNRQVDPLRRMLDEIRPDTELNEHGRKSTNADELEIRRIYWKSLRDVYIYKYFDEDTGEKIETLVDGNISKEIDETKGEELEKIWITEWWQGIHINDGIEDGMFIDIKPCPIQRRDINNPYISYPPYVGTIYNINDRGARSLVDELKPIQEAWTVHLKRAEMLWGRNMGKLVRIDISRIPALKGNKKDLETFMKWLYEFGIILEDPFQEGAKGIQAGALGNSVGTVDAELSSSIAQTVQWLNFLRDLADQVSGISEQRRGEGSASEGLGVTQERIIRSTNQTENLFTKHEYVKLRVLEALLETAKYTMLNGNKKLQYITDDVSYALLEIDKEKYTDADYGIKLTSSSKLLQFEDKLTRYTEYALNSGSVTLSDIMDIELTNSISGKVKRLKNAEEDRQKQAQEAKAKEQEMLQQMEQMKQQFEQFKAELDMMKTNNEYDRKLEIEQLKIDAGVYDKFITMDNDTNRNLIDDNVEIKKQQLGDQTKLKLEQLKQKHDRDQNERDRKNKLNLEKLKQRNKPTTTTK